MFARHTATLEFILNLKMKTIVPVHFSNSMLRSCPQLAFTVNKATTPGV
jgi:hypothetical protein